MQVRQYDRDTYLVQSERELICTPPFPPVVQWYLVDLETGECGCYRYEMHVAKMRELGSPLVTCKHIRRVREWLRNEV